MAVDADHRRPRVFSGIQPSGALTLGNYLGALRRWVAEQGEKESYFCIVDMHAITVKQDPELLRQRVLEVAAMYLACGLDPGRSFFFFSSCGVSGGSGSWPGCQSSSPLMEIPWEM